MHSTFATITKRQNLYEDSIPLPRRHDPFGQRAGRPKRKRVMNTSRPEFKSASRRRVGAALWRAAKAEGLAPVRRNTMEGGHSKTWRTHLLPRLSRSVLDCGSPLPLFLSNLSRRRTTSHERGLGASRSDEPTVAGGFIPRLGAPDAPRRGATPESGAVFSIVAPRRRISWRIEPWLESHGYHHKVASRLRNRPG